MGKGKGEEKGAGERLLWSDGRMMQCADDVLLSVHLKPVWFCKPMSP